jgi:hypothetical protein
MTQEPVQEGYSLIPPSSLVGLCVPYIVARFLQGRLVIYNSVSARCASKTKEALSSEKPPVVRLREADLASLSPTLTLTKQALMRPWLARPSAILTGDRLAITAGNYEGEGVTGGAGLCHGVRASFISAQDQAPNGLLHALYAPRKPASSTLGPCAATGMRDAAYKLPRKSCSPRPSVNRAPRASVAWKGLAPYLPLTRRKGGSTPGGRSHR